MPPKRAGAPRKVAASSSSARKRANEDPPQGVASKRSKNSSKAKRQKQASEEPEDPEESENSEAPPDDEDFEDLDNFNEEDNDSDPRNGLNQSLPPISNVYAAFQDIASRSQELLDGNSHIYLRVATLCSGTESPIFALKMLEEAFDRMQPGRQFLKFSHVFSAEIEPFKQAYIARNTEGAIIFNNVLDFIDPKDLKAPTAMGAMEEIPGYIDILIAGCSCVDFSTLNTQKHKDYSNNVVAIGNDLMKDIEKRCIGNGYNASLFEVVNKAFTSLLENINDMGTSGQTFFSMLKYVKDHRPKVVILENVMGAPWKQTSDIWFPFIGYKAVFVKADTKDYYIPQTRNRNYLLAIDKKVFGEEAASEIANRWYDLMKDLVRRASAPVNSWLLSPTHPLTERARQDDSEKALNPTYDAEWERSKARAILVREKEELGHSHPLTNWSLTQPGQPYDRMDRLVILTQSKRVLDCIDINHLRALKAGYDSRFKNRIHDLSQNIDRTNINTAFGITGCITPAGIHWVTDQCRLLSGYEMLGLQGLPLNRLQFATEVQQELRDLAGNAMTTTVVGTALVAALRAIQRSSLGLNGVFPNALKITEEKINRRVTESKLRELSGFSTTTIEPFQGLALTELLQRCRKYCFCNGSAKYSTDDFLECKICFTIRCKWCAGNPLHDFRPIKRPSNFLLLAEVEQEVMQFLPSTIVDLVSAEYETDLFPEKTIIGYPSLMNHLAHTTFYFRSTHVTEVVTVCYGDDKAFESAYGEEFRNELKLDHIRLEQPVAKATIKEGVPSIIPTPDSWQFWCFKKIKFEVEIDKNKSTLQVKKINVNGCFVPTGFAEDLRAAYGKFYHKPGCDAPEDSLHALDGKKLFLFKECTRTRTPDNDSYIISEECRLLETYEYRHVLLRFAASLNFLKLGSGTKTHEARVDGFWVNPQIVSHTFPSAMANRKHLDRFRVPSSKCFIIHEEDSDQQVLCEALFMRDKHCDQYGVIGKYEFLTNATRDWVTVGKVDLPLLNNFVSHVNVKLAGLESLEVSFGMADIDSWVKKLGDWRIKVDVRDSPFGQLPRAQWLQVAKAQGIKWVQHRDSNAMAAFESYVKNQVPPFEVRVKVHPTLLKDIQLGYTGESSYGDQFVAVVQYLINHKALGYQAASYLPPTRNSSAKVTAYALVERNAVLHENVQVHSDGSAKHSFVPFRESLKSLEEFSIPQDISNRMRIKMKSFKGKLSKFQSQSLGWTLWREMYEPEFTEREIEEETVPDLKLRLVGRVERKACHHGGILADQVGYGKTVVMLALMHCQENFDEEQSLKLRAAKSPHRIHLKASLILVPFHLVDQWAKEARKFLNIPEEKIITIKSLEALRDDKSLELFKEFQTARLIIVNLECIANPAYYQNLAKLAGSLDPPSDKFKETNFQHRPFEDWYVDSAPAAGDHAGKLLRVGLGNWVHTGKLKTLYHEIEGRREAAEKVYSDFSENYQSSVTTEAIPSKPASEKTRRDFAKNFKHAVKTSVIPEEPKVSLRFTSPQQLIPVFIDDESKGKKKKDLPKVEEFYHVLEAFTFARVVYDEFSYEGFFSTLFVSNLQAYSTWTLSATPPTRDLAAVCYTAKHFNVHVARPIRRRQGMPRITNGPVLEDRSNVEDIRIPKFVSDQTIRERHQQGMEFLQHFASSNPLDQDLSGGIEVEEKVVVCEMGSYEFVHYHDLEQELRAHNFDANLLPRESRYLLQPLVGEDWGANGKQVSTSALLYRSSHGNWLRGEYSTSCLLDQRSAVRLVALRIFGTVAEKAIWLSKRIWDHQAERNFTNGRNATTDIYMLLKDIWGKNLPGCGGEDVWEKLVEEVITKGGKNFDKTLEDMETSYPNFLMSEDRFFSALNRSTSNTWVDYYTLEAGDLVNMGEQEANALVQDLIRVHQDRATNLTRVNALSTLAALVNEDQARYRRIRKSIKCRVANVRIEQLAGKPTGKYLRSLCRAAGISFNHNDKLDDLKSRLMDAARGELDERAYIDYVQCDAMKPLRYPRLDEIVVIRGGRYTFTGNDASDTSIELRKAFVKAAEAIKQERIAKNLMLHEEQAECNFCRQPVPRQVLHIVCECGHLVCKEHLGPVYCGGGHGQRCSSSLKGPTMPLEKINIPQRRLNLGSGKQEDALCPRISSKFQMLINTVKALPDNEFAIVFFQYFSQLEELLYALRKNGIGFVYTAPTANAQRKFDERMGDELVKIDRLGSTGLPKLRDRCDERGIRWSQEEDVDDLRDKLERWKNKFAKTIKHPKLRLLRIDDVSSAGSNFQYANHVMFVTPFVVDLQEKYDSCMKQAIGRCVRFGQKKKVQVYHFVTANTVEVDILELRRQCHILVRPGMAIGRLQPAPVAEMKMREFGAARVDEEDTTMPDAAEASQPDNDGPDTPMSDAPDTTPDDPDREERVTSNLGPQEIWKAMNEVNWLTTVGIEY
ncbi:hypothetical protein F4774DRAFT_406188 [Daldinia eschscholtzii]|nr:hypothetical protein F4774DRAFT_406188 [Daldinia eschscholtzii]